MSYSQESQKNTNQTNKDSLLVLVRLSHVIKSNQAYIELKSLKRQSLFLDTLVSEKDRAFKRLLQANNLSHNLNREYETILKADRIKLAKCDEYGDNWRYKIVR